MVETRTSRRIKKARPYLIALIIVGAFGVFVWDIARSVRLDEDKGSETVTSPDTKAIKVELPEVVNAQSGYWDDPSLEPWQKVEPAMPHLSPKDQPVKYDPAPDEATMRRLKELDAVPN
jgi:hypothetical protein